MHDIIEFFSKIFDANNWPARWHCGKWTPFHGWLYILSNLIIALAYFSIPLLLLYLIKKTRHQLPFLKVFWLFLFFILACGFTHVFDALMFWYPVYRMSAFVLFLTAVVSSMAVIALYKVVPMALSLKSPAFLETIIQQRTQELEAANAVLVNTNHELTVSRQMAEKLLKQKDDFISIASHELKTPVTSLKMYTQLMSSDAFNASADKNRMYLKMDAQINKLTKLINDLLDTATLEQGQLNYEQDRFRLDETIKEVTEQVQLTTTTHQLVFINLAPLTVSADKMRIEQVISNLLTNAIKFSPGSQQVHISLESRDGKAVCSVTDFGMGIPAAEKERIFNKYHRIERKNSHTFPGLGLGLFIVRDIIEKQNGEVWMESELEKGSSFYFSLPL